MQVNRSLGNHGLKLKNHPDTILTLAPQYGASPHTRHTLKTMPFMDAEDKDWDTLW